MPTLDLEEQSNKAIQEMRTYLREVESVKKYAYELNQAETTNPGWEHKLSHCRIPQRYYSADIKNIPNNVANDLVGFMNHESYFIHGDVGCGKTYLICALIINYLKNMRYSVIENIDKLSVILGGYSDPYFISMPDMILMFKKSFKDDSEYSEDYLIDRFSNEHILLLDDIGVEKPSDWALQTIYSIIDRRNNNMRQTVFTSNYSIKDLKDRIGERIASRIVEMCGKKNIINLKGKDRRLA